MSKERKETESFESIVSRYKKLLWSYAIHEGLVLKSNGMDHVRGALCHLVKNGAESLYSKEILIAMAGVSGTLSIVEQTAMVVPFGLENRGDLERAMSEHREKAIDGSIRWLENNSVISRYVFGKKKNTLTQGEIRDILSEKLDEYYK